KGSSGSRRFSQEPFLTTEPFGTIGMSGTSGIYFCLDSQSLKSHFWISSCFAPALGSASGKAYSLPKPRRCWGRTSPKGTSLRSEARSRLGIKVWVKVWPSLVKNQLVKSFAALACGALAKTEMQQPDPEARNTPTFLIM